MLNRHQLKDYRILRGVSVRDVANYCDISYSLVTQVENGDKDVTEYNHAEIVKGINAAYAAKKNGTLVKGDQKNKKTESKSDSVDSSENIETEKKVEKKKTAEKKSTKKKKDDTKK